MVVEKVQELDDYFKQPNNNYQLISAVFCCLGCEIKHGEEMFVKIDKIFPLLAADIAVRNSNNDLRQTFLTTPFFHQGVQMTAHALCISGLKDKRKEIWSQKLLKVSGYLNLDYWRTEETQDAYKNFAHFAVVFLVLMLLIVQQLWG